MDRRAIIVLGMHRSGTSALAGALASAGLQLPRRLLGAAPSNPKGHFEPNEIVSIHDRLLAALDTTWYGLEELPDSRFASAEASGFADELVSAIATDYPGPTPFIMKDPRVCRLMPLWREVLPRCHAKPLFVLPVRNPLDVAESLNQRNSLPREHGCLLWLRHVLDAEFQTRGLRRVFIHYHDLLRRPAATVAAITKTFGIREAAVNGNDAAAIDSFVDPGLRHFNNDARELGTQGELGRWLDAAYKAHHLLIERPDAGTGQELLDELRANLTAPFEVFASLVGQLHRDIAERDYSISTLNQNSAGQNERILQLTQRLAGQEESFMKNIIQEHTAEFMTELRGVGGKLAAIREEVCAQRENHQAQLLGERERWEHQSEAMREFLRAGMQAREALHAAELARMTAELGAAREETRAQAASHQAGLLRERERLERQSEAARETLRTRIRVLQEAHAEELRQITADLTTARQQAREQAMCHRAELDGEREKSQRQLEAAQETLRTRIRALQDIHATDIMNERRAHERELESERAQRKAENLEAAKERAALLAELHRKTEEHVRELAQLERTGDVSLPAKLRSLRRAVIGHGKWRRLIRDYRSIAASPLFDAEWYLASNPDVAAAKMDPVLHYLRNGAAERRAPGPHFDAAAYLQVNRDVSVACVNPLLHYLRHGIREARCASISPKNHPAIRDVLHRFQRPLAGEKNPSILFALQKKPQASSFDYGRYITTHPDIEVARLLPLHVSVSVVIPAYNAGRELRLLVEKLFRQKGLKSIEVVIVDSGSTDGTPETGTRLGCKVIEIKQSEFSHSHSRNVGADGASGDILVFMVQDAYPIGDHWLYGLAKCLLQPQSKDTQVSAVSCAEYPRVDSELFYDALLKGHYDFIGCSERDRVGKFIAEDNLNLRKQGQLSDVACAIPRHLFNKYRFFGNYAEDLTLGIRLIRDGHHIGMLSSIRVIHSHSRPPHYYLRRAFVDLIFLADIFSDMPLPVENCIVGSLTGYLFLKKALRSTIVPCSGSPAAFLEQYIAEVRDAAPPPYFKPFESQIDLDYVPLISWMKRVSDAATDLRWKIDDISMRSLKRTQEMFADRLSVMLPLLRTSYPIIDASVAKELYDSIQKTLAMTVGSQLAFCYLKPRMDIKDDNIACLLKELTPIMLAGI